VRIVERPAAAALGVLSVLMIACTENPFATAPGDGVESTAPSFRIAAPGLPGGRFVSNEEGDVYSVIDNANLSVRLDGVPLPLDERDAEGRTVVRWSRPPGSRVELAVEWAESIPLDNGTNLSLQLATYEQSMTIERAESIVIGPDDYTVNAGPGGERDQDSDGDSNLLERMTGFSPFNGSVCPESCDFSVALYIKRVERRVTDRIEIDGEYDDEWNLAEFDGRDGRLRIDEPGLSSEPGGGNGGPARFSAADSEPFQFLAMHDGERLYMVILGDGDVSRNTPVGDSGNPADDDSITLYLDTDDPSDGTLTSTLVVPLMGLNTGESDNSDSPTARARRFDFDSGSSYLPTDLRYATCVCDGSRQFWELSVPLAGLGIAAGQPFGLEVAVNDDSTGGNSATQWLWHSAPEADGSVVPGLVVVR